MTAGHVVGLLVLLLVISGCGDRAGAGEDGAAALPSETHRRVLSQGVDPALVYTVEVPGFELAEQSVGVLGDADYGAVYVPIEPPRIAEVALVVRAGSYDRARCEHDPLLDPRAGSDGSDGLVARCETEGEGWYRAGDGWHEYVVPRAGHHITVAAPVDAVDRDALRRAALGARPVEGAVAPIAPASPPASRGDLPTTGDGAPVDPYGASPPGG